MAGETDHQTTVRKRLRILGMGLLAAGLAVAAGGFLYGLPQAKAGLDSAQALYAAQGVRLAYDGDGTLTDRGTREAAQAIMELLEEAWQYPVDHSSFDPGDPLINTRDELMFQYATLTQHILIREMPITLTEEDLPVKFRGVLYEEPGTYRFTVGDYFANLDRTHPIEGPLREAWSPAATGLLASLAAGHANQAAGELALFTSLGMGSIGLLFAGLGGGLIWVSFSREEFARARRHV